MTTFNETATGGIRTAGQGLQVQTADCLVVYQALDIDHWHEIDTAAGVAEATLQYTVYSNDYYQKNIVADQIRYSLHGYQGPMGAKTVLNSEVTQVIDGSVSDNVTDWLYSRIVQAKITYRESVPLFDLDFSVDESDVGNSIATYLKDYDSLAAYGVWPSTVDVSVNLDDGGHIVYERVTGGDQVEIEEDPQQAYQIWEFTCIHPIYDEAHKIAEILRGALDGLSGTIGTANALAIWHKKESDALPFRKSASDDLWYAVPVQYEIIFDL